MTNDIELVIKIPEKLACAGFERLFTEWERDALIKAIGNGTLLPKGHGRIVDIGKIDKDRIESDNPVYLTVVNGEYIEAVSLDYLNNLPPIVEADTENNIEGIDYNDEIRRKNNKESIPYLMHKEMGVPISECQKAYDIAIEYLRSQAKVKG